MEKLNQTKFCIHQVTGLLNFLGGSFDVEKVNRMPFGDVIDSLLRNGGEITINISEGKRANPRNLLEEL